MWTPFKFLVGNWQGMGSGQPGNGRYERSYEYVLNGTFLYVRNKSSYPPTEQFPKGEVHEDWGIFSRDKARNTFVYRQFHAEGFVNQYILDYLAPDLQTFSFITESIENIPAGWRAKESYQVITPDEFIETFQLAEPGNGFELYSQCHLMRAT